METCRNRDDGYSTRSSCRDAAVERLLPGGVRRWQVRLDVYLISRECLNTRRPGTRSSAVAAPGAEHDGGDRGAFQGGSALSCSQPDKMQAARSQPVRPSPNKRAFTNQLLSA